MTKLAIYDLDRTITRQGTYTAFLIYAAARRGMWRLALLPVFILAMLIYKLGFVRRKHLKELGFRLLIGPRIAASELRRLGEAFARRTIDSNVPAGARAQIEADHAEGRTLVIATAAPAYYAEAIGRLLGFDGVVSTRNVETSEGDILPTIIDENCYGPEKLRRIEGWLVDQKLECGAFIARFYSDHHSDAPCFRWADEPIVVNPSRALLRLAEAEKWQTRRFD